MKNQIQKLFLALLLFNASLSAYAQGTAFTYQGRLNDNGSPANGAYDLQFSLRDAGAGGNSVGGTNTIAPVAVSNGLFTVTLDFGAGVFTGAERWLEIGVKSNGVAGAHTPLTPVQPLTSSPYAIFAGGAQSATTVAPGGVSNASIALGAVNSTAIADSAIETNDLSASLLNGTFWRLDGNSGAGNFLGSTDFRSLEFRVNNTPALRLVPTPFGANSIGGYSSNSVRPGVSGATISGGGEPDYPNRIEGDFSAIVGGVGNTNSGRSSFIGGGAVNNIQAASFGASFIGGGQLNVIGSNGFVSVIAGGQGNVISNLARYSTISGGDSHVIETDSRWATIGGGRLNRAAGFSTSVGGGERNTAENFFSTVGGGLRNSARGGNSVVAGGTVAGGNDNVAGTNASFVGGGNRNTNISLSAVIGGGEANTILHLSEYSTIGGGRQNRIQTNSDYSVISGGNQNVIHDVAGASMIAGGRQNTVQTNSTHAVIGGGQANSIAGNANHAVIGGGSFNTNSGGGAVIGGGFYNRADYFDAVVAGGAFNINAGYRAFIGGGEGNVISNTGPLAVVGGGYANRAQGNSATVGGGGFNNASGLNATVPGGVFSDALGDYSFATGRRAKAFHPGAFVWADSTDADFTSTANNQFSVRASGGVRFVTGGAGMTLDGVNVLSGIVPSASLSGTYSSAVVFNNPANSFTGNGANLTSLNANNLSSGTVPDARLSANVSLLGSSIASAEIADGTIAAADVDAASFNTTFWRTTGNAGTTPGTHFLGTTDNSPVEFRVNGGRALRLEPTAGSNAVNVIGGSAQNSVAAGVEAATIAGGGLNPFPNTITASYATIGGGTFNTVGGGWATIAGGRDNRVTGNYSTVSGGNLNVIQTNSDAATIGGGDGNSIRSATFWPTIGGGRLNVVGSNNFSPTIAGGEKNVISPNASFSSIGGGLLNSVASENASVAGGSQNTIQTNAINATISGGGGNIIEAGASYATIGGGLFNLIQSNAYCATIPGGCANSVASYGFAAGRRAKANHTGAFVWADSTDADFVSGADNQFAIRASGGVQLSDSTPNISFGAQTRQMLNLLDDRYAIGVQKYTVYFRTDEDSRDNGFAWFKGGRHSDDTQDSGGGVTLMTLTDAGLTVNGVFVSASDRNLKENFAPVSPRDVLEKVSALAISRWNFKGDAATPHVGPMAQDFHAAFGLGTDDKHIATVDADGVALAAIQGLNQKVDAKERRIHELEEAVSELKQLVRELSGKKEQAQ